MSTTIASKSAIKFSLFDWQGVVPEREEVELRIHPETGAERTVQGTPTYLLGEDHPLTAVFGAFANEPLWDDWMESIQQARNEHDKSED